MYSAQLLDHFQNPRFAGELPAAPFRARLENPVCGDILELTAEIRDGRLTAIRFRAKGCVPAMACASAICELAANQPLSIVRGIRKEDLLAAVGGVPPASDHAAQLALDTLSTLLRNSAASGDAASVR